MTKKREINREVTALDLSMSDIYETDSWVEIVHVLVNKHLRNPNAVEEVRTKEGYSVLELIDSYIKDTRDRLFKTYERLRIMREKQDEQ